MSYETDPHCVICEQAVDLTESKADEYGQAVHEDCYVSRLVSQKVHARADCDHLLRIQTGERMPFLVRRIDDLSRVVPTPHRVHGGFWY